ncbi:MAG: hypothetical protein Q9187_003603 [Circinaria calcarea]
MSKKRTLDTFFQSTAPKKARVASDQTPKPNTDAGTHLAIPYDNHPTYPYSIPHFPSQIASGLSEVPAAEGKEINDQPDLDLLYFQPYIPKSIEKQLFEFLRQDTTVFGVDETSRFAPDGSLIDTQTSKPIPSNKYPTCKPRPIPHCLDELRKITEIFTSSSYNFCLVNYYATGADSISYHSDDERFLGPKPSIASFSLGAKRDFLMKHKPTPPSVKDLTPVTANEKPLKLTLASGDMVLMRGPTQSNWLHSIPKRKGGDSDKGRINITFRKAMVKYGTENYYQYNVGNGGVWRWDGTKGEMIPWVKEKVSSLSRDVSI